MKSVVSPKQIKNDNGLADSELVALTLNYEASASPATRVEMEAKLLGFALPESPTPLGLDSARSLATLPEMPALPSQVSPAVSRSDFYFVRRDPKFAGIEENEDKPMRAPRGSIEHRALETKRIGYIAAILAISFTLVWLWLVLRDQGVGLDWAGGYAFFMCLLPALFGFIFFLLNALYGWVTGRTARDVKIMNQVWPPGSGFKYH